MNKPVIISLVEEEGIEVIARGYLVGFCGVNAMVEIDDHVREVIGFDLEKYKMHGASVDMNTGFITNGAVNDNQLQ